MDPCAMALAERTANRIVVRCETRKPGTSFRQRDDDQMNALPFRGFKSPDAGPERGALLRLLDTLAEWQMSHAHSVISRVQADSATISGVTQPSNSNERSSTSPCDR
jgi:hypothetical protein